MRDYTLVIEYQRESMFYTPSDAAQLTLLMDHEMPHGEFRALFATEYEQRVGPFSVLLLTVLAGWVVITPTKVHQFFGTPDSWGACARLWPEARDVFVSTCIQLMEDVA